MAESEEYWFIIPVLGIGIALWLVFTLRYLFWVPNLDEKHVLVTGGSSGIGKCVAIAAARFGAHVSIIGSDSVKLFAVRKEIMKARKNDTQLVTCTVADVGHLRELEPAMETIVGAVNEVDMLVTCAGFAVCGTFEQVPYFDVNHMIQTNLIGTLNAVRLVVPSMKRRQSGNIVLVGSQVSLMGLYGYSGYACSKFGVRGLGESLQMEVKPYDVQVTLCLPPDTGTPGFETENKSDPDKTKKICSADVLEDPETVAIALIKDALSGKFFSTVGFSSHILTSLCVGMSPVTNPLKLVWQCLTLGLLRVIGIIYLWYFDFLVSKHVHKKPKKVN